MKAIALTKYGATERIILREMEMPVFKDNEMLITKVLKKYASLSTNGLFQCL